VSKWQTNVDRDNGRYSMMMVLLIRSVQALERQLAYMNDICSSVLCFTLDKLGVLWPVTGT